jgi:hypothetical protein
VYNDDIEKVSISDLKQEGIMMLFILEEIIQ